MTNSVGSESQVYNSPLMCPLFTCRYHGQIIASRSPQTISVVDLGDALSSITPYHVPLYRGLVYFNYAYYFPDRNSKSFMGHALRQCHEFIAGNRRFACNAHVH